MGMSLASHHTKLFLELWRDVPGYNQNDYLLHVDSDESTTSSMCGRAISTLRSVRRLTEESRREQRKNFAPYSLSSSSKGKGKGKERVHPRTVRLFCLSDTSQCKVPSTACLKILLLGAGLKEMSVKVPDVNSCSMEDLREIHTPS